MSQNPRWYQKIYTYIWIFNTGRGLSVCIRLPHNIGVLYDLGASDEFSPAAFIAENIAPHLTRYSGCAIAQCFLSHPHADHISEIDAISGDANKSKLYPWFLTCPNDKVAGESVDFDRILNNDNRELIGKYRSTYAQRTPPLQTIQNIGPCRVPNVEYGFYYLVPPKVNCIHSTNDQHYGNGLSLVFYLRHGSQSILIPGDITPDVLDLVLEGQTGVVKRFSVFGQSETHGDWHSSTSTQPTLRDLLADHGLSVLIAPHHGLESCFSRKLFEAMRGGKPMINVISEKRHLSESDGKVDNRYQNEAGASGIKVDIDGYIDSNRRSVSTRDGHHILLVFQGTNLTPRVYLRKNPLDLLQIV